MTTTPLLQNELNELLVYATDILSISHAFISVEVDGMQSIQCKVGLKSLKSITEIPDFDLILKHNSDSFILNMKTNILKRYNGLDSLLYLIGLPIRTSKNNGVIATICIFSTKQSFQPREWITLHHVQSQIASILALYNENEYLKNAFELKELHSQSFISNAKELYYHLDLKGTFTHLSENWNKLMGYTINELLGKSYHSLIYPDDLSSCELFLDYLFKSENSTKEHTFRIKKKDGNYIWFNSTITVIRTNNIVFFSGVAREIIKYAWGEDTLREQKKFYENILNELPLELAVYDTNLRYRFVNSAAIQDEKLRKAAIGKTNLEYEQLTDRNLSFGLNRQLKIEETIASKQALEWVEEMINKKTGEYNYFNRRLNPVFNSKGIIEMVIGSAEVINKSTFIDKQSESNKKLITNNIHNLAIGILIYNKDSEVIDYNSAACEILGLTHEELLGRTSLNKHLQIIQEDGSPFLYKNFPVSKAIEKLLPVNNTVMRVSRPKNNDSVWILVDAIPICDSKKKLLYVVCSFNDITKQKNTEKALELSNERFENVSNATSDIIWEWDILTDLVIVSDSFTQQFGYSLKGKILNTDDFLQNIHLEDYATYTESLYKSIESTDFNWESVYKFRKANGQYATVKDKAIIIRDVNGKATRVVGAMNDITSEIKLQNEFEHSEKQFKEAFNNSGAGMAIIDLNGFVKVANTQIVKILGYSEKELSKHHFSYFCFPEDAALDLQNRNALLSGEISNYSIEKRYIDKNGSTVFTLLFVSLIRSVTNEPLHFIAQIIDITQKKEIEQVNKELVEENNKNRVLQLNEAKNMYRLLADNMVDLICVHNLNGILHYVSPSIFNIFGYNDYEVIGKSAEDFVHPDEKKLLKRCIENILAENGKTNAKIRFRKKNNKYLWCEIKGNLVKENGVPISFHTSTRDISVSKNAEMAIEKTLQRERELNELRANLVSTISHEFRTPMTTIRSSAELIALYLKNQPIENQELVQKRIATIKGEIDRIVALMNTVLVISKDDLGKTDFEPLIFDLKQTCIDVVEICDFDQKDGRKVNIIIVGSNFAVFADKNLMEYIFLNLLNNAFKYSKESGKEVDLKITKTIDFISVEITDYGLGIPEVDQDKLFNTFFRASNTHGIQGTGLGLYIVKTFTERNGGTISLKSKLGTGTVVNVQFPVAKY